MTSVIRVALFCNGRPDDPHERWQLFDLSRDEGGTRWYLRPHNSEPGNMATLKMAGVGKAYTDSGSGRISIECRAPLLHRQGCGLNLRVSEARRDKLNDALTRIAELGVSEMSLWALARSL